jgi:hypothetical protein
MASNHSELWVKAIREVLEEDGKPPLTVGEENDVRLDIDKMTAARDLRSAQDVRAE